MKLLTSSLMLVFLLASLSAEAGTTALQSLMFSFGLIQDPEIQICPANPALDAGSTEEHLLAKAHAGEGAYDKCLPARYYRSLIVNHPRSAFYKEAYRAYLETYLKAQDFIMAINEGNAYLEAPPAQNDSEYIHLLVLRAVQGQIRQGWRNTEKQSEFVAYSLGADLQQNEESPWLMNLRYGSFLEHFPNSFYKDEVLGMVNESRQMYGQKLLQEARTLVLKMDYPGAFLKYNIILKWGPVVDVFGEALYEMIQYHIELAWIITDPNLLNDYKLNDFLSRDIGTKSSLEERKVLSEKTLLQAQKYFEQMKLNLPQSLWTKKASVLIH